ncbi:YceI family protein [Paenibacillus sp. N4]|uniref:YceI family protein n=1 Tax=Paenibacillus vietnamensis TaxID=2590547 RepID=UPI001CD04B0B|nr:YceI family protein [Paenibacillus vietnamensis]MCA0755449.1 YceI family protein [Paenibacillus vietnamensis]
MNKKIIAGLAAGILVLGGGLYWAVGELTGNRVEIESVIAEGPAENNVTELAGQTSAGGEGSAEAASAAEPADVDGTWTIQPDSKAYFSVTTSRESVNYEMDQVSGTWTINSGDPSLTKADGTVELSSMDSGNAQRDIHISEAEFMDVAQFPTAHFTATSFEGMPAEWTDGQVYEVNIRGNLTVKGITKEVAFTGKATVEQGQLKLEAGTIVTFEDFGMKNPHNVVVQTENELTVELRLILSKS